MKKIEVIVKNVMSPRLTIAKDRITIKFPFNYENQEEVQKKLMEIAEKHPEPLNTLRGEIRKDTITLRNSKEKFKYSLL